MSDEESYPTAKILIRPNPGGRRVSFAVKPLQSDFSPSPSGSAAHRADVDSFQASNCNDNPVIAAAMPLLSLVSRLRGSTSHREVEELQRQLLNEIAIFKNKILQQGIQPDLAQMAGYVLCALLDETVLSTPWGWQSSWTQNSLLNILHQETIGRDEVFPIIDHLRQQSAKYLDLLEFCYLCLSLGLQGRYGKVANGDQLLAQYRSELYQLIQAQRGAFEPALSPHWQGLAATRGGPIRFVPLWIIATLSAASLFLVFLGLLFSINSLSDQIRNEMEALAVQTIKAPVALPVQRQHSKQSDYAVRLAQLLTAEIKQNKVELVDARILRIHNVFPAASDQVAPDTYEIIIKIAAALSQTPAEALVIGHTDGVPIRSVKFPSNWDLSNARAKRIADLLVSKGALAAGKIQYKGRADTEPLAASDTPEHRAINRRVEIVFE